MTKFLKIKISVALCFAGFLLFGLFVSTTPASATTYTWNPFLGGGGDDQGYAIAVDTSGNIYIAGTSTVTWGSPVRPYTTSDKDVFVTKLDSAGNLIWNTFLGGSGNDVLSGGANILFGGIAVDGNNNIYVSGYSTATWQGTQSPISPYVAGNGDNAFVAKLDNNGGLLWNTFIGSSGGTDYTGAGIAVDTNGNLYVTGLGDAAWTYPGLSPVQAYTSSYEAWVAKMDSTSGAMTWYTFLGGSGVDLGSQVAADASGNVYVVGRSNATWGSSPKRAFVAGNFNVFAAKLTSAGVLSWNTFLGDSGNTAASYLAIDGSGNTYVAGSTWDAWGSPTRRAYSGNGFNSWVAKLDSTGVLTWNTFQGSFNGGDYPGGLAVDGSGNVYVGGYGSASWGSPIKRAYSSGVDAMLTKLDSTGAFVWDTFLGGAGNDYGSDIKLDSNGNIYVVGYTTATWGTPPKAFTGGANDIFIAKILGSGASVGNLVSVHKVTPTTGANGSVSPAVVTNVNDGDNLNFVITPATHYHVADVLADSVSVGAVTSYTFTNVTADHTIATTFAIDTNALTYTANSNGTITGTSPQTINYGSDGSQVTATPSAHYHFVSWSDSSTTNPRTDTNVTGNISVSASFSIDTNAITSSAGSHGSISPNGTTNVNYGSDQSYTITPSVHYHVADVLVDSVSVGAVTSYTFTNVTTTHTIAATFAIDTYTVTASTVNSNGSITPAGTTTLNYGASQTYAITANTPYTTNVIVDGASQGPLTTYTFTNVTANHTIVADFSLVLGGGGGGGAGVSSGAGSATSTSATSSTSDSSSQAVETSTPPLAIPEVGTISTSGSSATATAAVIVQIKQQLVALITQLIGILQQQFIQMGK
ncbi:MAG: SBBP repeat-containing protein [Candidatus Staskawiczbacteria bacterium]|nr:SBBP repeat-containing protein [Candidatus Staskawiczbacteria bacterium]